MSDNYAVTSPSAKDNTNDKVYVKFSLSKYPFLRNKKHGDTGSVSFKAEIEGSENDEDGSAEHRLTFNDLSNKPNKVRV